MDFGH